MWSCIKSDLVINEKLPQKNCLKQSQKTLFEILFCFSFYYRKKRSNRKKYTVFLPEHDTEAISLSSKSVERIETSLNLCLEKHSQLDTFTVYHLLWKLNSNKCNKYACTSPMNRVGLPYFADHLNTKGEQKLFCIPLCDGAHFQGYIIDIGRSVIIDIDSLSNNKPESHISQKIANLYFESN